TLVKEFIAIAIFSNVIAWFFSYWIMDQWLSDFAYRIPTPYALMPINLVFTLLTIFLLVGVQSSRVSRLNPIEVIKSE
ncbi:MAG: hypothetical protein AAF789_11550, partial [Bacteroidota bacterium]